MPSHLRHAELLELKRLHLAAPGLWAALWPGEDVVQVGRVADGLLQQRDDPLLPRGRRRNGRPPQLHLDEVGACGRGVCSVHVSARHLQTAGPMPAWGPIAAAGGSRPRHPPPTRHPLPHLCRRPWRHRKDPRVLWLAAQPPGIQRVRIQQARGNACRTRPLGSASNRLGDANHGSATPASAQLRVLDNGLYPQLGATVSTASCELQWPQRTQREDSAVGLGLTVTVLHYSYIQTANYSCSAEPLAL